MTPLFDQKLTKLVKGELQYVSKESLGLNLLLSNSKRQYTANPTQAELTRLKGEIVAFFQKYASIMAKEVAAIESL